jgi:UDP-glucose 4-epimerase
MSERALVTGGAGCIGSDLAARLVAEGVEVIALDNLSSGRREHIAPLEARRNFHFIEGDLLRRAALDAAMAGVDIVYHLAANPDVKFREGEPTDKDLRQNTLATYNVLESARVNGCRRLVFASTSAVYGIPERLPIAEDHPCRPISLYGASKLACEALIGAFQNLFGMECWIFRLANVVGSKERKRGRTVIGDFIDALRRDPRRLTILGDGRQAKSYLASEEAIDAILHAVRHAPAGLNIYNVGCRDSLSVRRIADLVVDAMGLRGVEYEFTGGAGGWPGDVPRFTLDVTAMERLGWSASLNSEQAVALAIRASLERLRSGAECKP